MQLSFKTALVLFLFIAFSTSAQDRDTTWIRGGNVALFLQHVGLSNWAGGGESSLAYGTQASLFLKHITETHTWENSLEGGYGLLDRKGATTRKNVDFLILRSKYGSFFAPKWQISGLLEFRTQFAPGYKYQADPNTNAEQRILISDLMAPGYLQAIAGLTYRPNKRFNMTFSPLSNKMTFVLNDSLSDVGAFGVDPGDKLFYEFGTSLAANWERSLMENVNLKTNLQLFADYSDLNHIDIFWDIFLDMKINKWLTTNFTVQMIYDHDIKIEDSDGDIGPRLQLRNMLNVGISIFFGDELDKKD